MNRDSVIDIPYDPKGKWYTLGDGKLLKRIGADNYLDNILKVGDNLSKFVQIKSDDYLDKLLIDNRMILHYKYNEECQYIIIDDQFKSSPFFNKKIEVDFVFLDKKCVEWKVTKIISFKEREPSVYVINDGKKDAILKIFEFDKAKGDRILPQNYDYKEPGITAFFRSKYCWVVDVYDWINDYYLIMEMADKTATNVDKNLVKSIGLQMIDILENIHDNGFYHQDIKPENIGLIGDKVKLFDLDLIKSELIQFDDISDNKPQKLISPIFHTNEPVVLDLFNKYNKTHYRLYDYSDYPEPVTYCKLMDMELLMLSLIFMYNPELLNSAKKENNKSNKSNKSNEDEDEDGIDYSYGYFQVKLANESPCWLKELYMETLRDRSKLLIYNKENKVINGVKFYKGFYFKRDYIDYDKYRRMINF